MKSRKELVKDSIPFFNQHEVSELHATTDGQYFLDRNRADLHARSVKKIKVYTIEASEIDDLSNSDGSDDLSSETAKTLIKTIKTIEDIEKLKLFLKQEKDGKNRSTVIEAIESQIEDVNNKDQ